MTPPHTRPPAPPPSIRDQEWGGLGWGPGGGGDVGWLAAGSDPPPPPFRCSCPSAPAAAAAAARIRPLGPDRSRARRESRDSVTAAGGCCGSFRNRIGNGRSQFAPGGGRGAGGGGVSATWADPSPVPRRAGREHEPLQVAAAAARPGQGPDDSRPAVAEKKKPAVSAPACSFLFGAAEALQSGARGCACRFRGREEW